MAQFSDMPLPAMPRASRDVTKAIGTDPAYWLGREGPPSPATPGNGQDLDQPGTRVGEYLTIALCYYCGGPAVEIAAIGPLCAGHVAAHVEVAAAHAVSPVIP